MNVQKTYETDVKNQLQQIDSRIQKLAGKIDEIGSDASKQYEAEMADLRRRRQSLNQRIESMKQASGDAWQEVKAGLDDAMSEMDQALERAADHFNKVAA